MNDQPSQNYLWRYRIVVALIVLVAVAVAGRSVHLHVFEGEFLREEGAKRFLRTEKIEANRGMVFDRNGEALAVSTPLITVILNPRQIMDEKQKIKSEGGEQAETAYLKHWRRIAELSGHEFQDLMAEIEQRAGSGSQFMYLRRHMVPQDAESIMALDVVGVYDKREYRRYYPAGEVASHLVGFTNIDHEGQEGIELAFDDILKGKPGQRRVVKDRKGRVVEDLGIVEAAAPGEDLHLSIDLRAQYLAYRELKAAVQFHKAQAGSLVAIDVATGEILAMVNQPSYNPNDRSQFDYAKIRNRAMTDVFEPGSTAKPFTVLAALQSGKYEPHTLVDTSPGYMRVGRKLIRDHRNYGEIDLATVITKSSNVGASKIAMTLQPESIVNIYRRLGLGQSTGIGFPGEQIGKLPYHQRWKPLDIATLSYGYGVSVTTLQLAHAYATVANHGKKVPLSLLRLDQVPEGERALSESVAKDMIAMLETVVSDKGTASQARVAGFRVAGKTGTAHKLTESGYAADRYRALFAGLAPASDPRIAMVVMIDDPKGEEYYGGQVAGPVFSNVMAGVLRVKNVVPDRATEPLLSYLSSVEQGGEQ